MSSRNEEMIYHAVPSFARFIIDKHLDEYIATEVRTSIEMKIPVWEKFAHVPIEVLIENSSEFFGQFIKDAAENGLKSNLERSIRHYKLDVLKNVGRHQITPEDFLLTHEARKKTLRHFLHLYTGDAQIMLRILDELDHIFLQFSVAATNAYINILNNIADEEQSIKRKLYSTSPGSYYIYDLENDIQILPSERLFEKLGYTKEDYDGNKHFFKQIMHPADLASSLNYIAALGNVVEGEVRFFEYRLKAAGGEYRWIRNYETVHKWSGTGLPSQMLGVAFDITQEHHYEEEIQLKDEALAEAQDLAHIGTFSWDLEKNKLTGFSHNLEKLGLRQGNTFEEVIGCIHDVDKPRVLQIFEHAIAGKTAYECEYRCTIDDRERIIWSKGRVVYVDDKPKFLKATVMDVTNQHQMVRKLQRSEELYKQAQVLNKIGNWSWKIGSDRVQWSDELFRIYGLEPQSELITLDRYCTFIHKDDIRQRKEMLDEQINNPGHREYYFRINAADGKEKIIYGQSEVLVDENGKGYKMIGTCQDVTAQKTLEKNLYENTIQLQKTNASLKIFSHISSHDLKEPLRKISLFGDRLRMLNNDKLDDQSRTILQTIIQSSLRLQQMIDQIVSVSRINSEEKFELTDLNCVLNDVLGELSTHIISKNAKINADQLPKLVVNGNQLRQLFMNLIGNALKFSKTDPSPVISITVDKPSLKEINGTGLENMSSYIRIRIKDNGIGFQDIYAEKIFAIFQRLHDKAAYPGNGIGLAVSREIVNHHGGIIHAQGFPGEGSIFTIILPEKTA
ncbi:MAG: PAS domain-containing protein [Flavitalea sp.]